jgi:hypothetical protein
MEKSKIVLEWKKEVGHLITIAADTDGTTEKVTTFGSYCLSILFYAS